MKVSMNELIEDISMAASIACDGFFGPLTIEDDITHQRSVGDCLDTDQLQKFINILESGVGVQHNVDGYNCCNVGLKFESFNNDTYMVYWDEIVEIMMGDVDYE